MERFHGITISISARSKYNVPRCSIKAQFRDRKNGASGDRKMSGEISDTVVKISITE